MSDQKLVNKMIELVAERSIEKSSQVLSKMLKQGARIDLRRVSFMDISIATEDVNKDSKEVVAAFIDLVGDVTFKFLFFVGIEESFVLTDLFLGQEVGTTKVFDEMTESAIQEIGNIISSAISNVFSADFQMDIKPAPPVVTLDYSGTLFQEFIMDAAVESNEILLIESVFRIFRSDLDCHMCLLPVSGVEKALGLIDSKTRTKILVIDDARTDRALYKAMLTKEGYDVEAVESVKDAFLILEKQTFDLILCDYCMPDIDGEKFLQMIRKDVKLRHNVVIIITSDERQETKIRLLRHGANDFIIKGSSCEELSARITAHLKVGALSRLAAHTHFRAECAEKINQLMTVFDESMGLLKGQVESIKDEGDRSNCLEMVRKTNFSIEKMKELLEKSGKNED